MYKIEKISANRKKHPVKLSKVVYKVLSIENKVENGTAQLEPTSIDKEF